MKKTIAILITCHNRKLKTLACLKRLYKLERPNNLEKFEVYLVDDGSSDGTSEAIKKEFSEVNVIQGNGNLFWNKGMRLAWDTAVNKKEYDFYLWVNDDVILENDALIELFDCYNGAIMTHNQESIVTGAFRNSEFTDKFSYGGRIESEDVIPNGKLQQCKYINGNTVLVSKKIYSSLGNLSPDYTHAMGDFDYGLRAIQAGFKNFTTKKYIGICPTNEEPQWSNPKVPLKQRLKLFRSPLGLNFEEYIVFRRKFWKRKWIIFAIKAYFKVLLPSLYRILKK
ncbi:MAG: glycosyltransferase family 2 protein [Flavobacteriaceae bacterium]|nr:glycosyltransferase family 2 protein [Flavobacteriaceae bacterium]